MIRKYNFILRYQSQRGRNWLLLFYHVGEEKVGFCEEKVGFSFYFSTEGFQSQLAKTQPKPQKHLLTFVVRHNAEGSLHHGFCGFDNGKVTFHFQFFAVVFKYRKRIFML